MPGSGGTGPGSRDPDNGGIFLLQGNGNARHVAGIPSAHNDLAVLVLRLAGLLGLTGLLVGLLVLPLLLLALLAFALLLFPIMLRLLRVAVLRVVHH